jgi:dTDP-4-dehydrorhamnose 3,5-epimerase
LERRETTLAGVLELRPKVFRDSRGLFLETYHRKRFAEIGINDTFVQDNCSISEKNTVRGLHYQLHRGQAKLCRVAQGEALDVVVDIRFGSPTFGKWASVTLSAELQNQIYIPSGFAHGFLALTQKVQFLYKCSDFYDSSDEHGVLWNDPSIGIPWGIASPLVSPKDLQLPRLMDVPQDILPSYRVP